MIFTSTIVKGMKTYYSRTNTITYTYVRYVTPTQTGHKYAFTRLIRKRRLALNTEYMYKGISSRITIMHGNKWTRKIYARFVLCLIFVVKIVVSCV